MVRTSPARIRYDFIHDRPTSNANAPSSILSHPPIHILLRRSTWRLPASLDPRSNTHHRLWRRNTSPVTAMDPLEESPWGDPAQSASQPSQDDPASQADTKPSEQTTSSARPSRAGPRRFVAQPTRLEAVDDPLGPLGPLGGPSGPATPDLGQDAPPVPPQKEDMVIRTTMPSQQARRPGPADPHRIDDGGEGYGPGGPRAPPPVQAAMPSPVRSANNPSMSVEQASRPTFHISVGDPHKVGDFTSSHVQYAVRTQVRAP